MVSDMPSRRVLFITGAGASVNLGTDGVDIPMMKTWSTSLVEELHGWGAKIGLVAEMDGGEFEAALGRYLAFERVFPSIAPYAGLGAEGQYAAQADPPPLVMDWFSRTTGTISTIRRGILRNLFESFGRDRLDDDRAIRAYSALHRHTRDADGTIAMSDRDRAHTPECYLAHATTNYDQAIETAVDDDVRLELLDGFARRGGGGSDRYQPSTITGQMRDSTARVPVLHLHGAVGWYFNSRNDGVTRVAADREYDERQTPALLLPDDQKDPARFESPARETWAAFEEVLAESTHVFLIGHSLHDAHVVKALQASEASIAIMIHSEPDTHGNYKMPKDSPLLGEARRKLGNITGVPGSFGQAAEWPDFDIAIYREWLRSTGRKLNTP